MTVNERLFVCGLMADFDVAIRERKRKEAIEVLSKVAMTEKEAAYTIDTILKNPAYYGY